jgi:penicillin G amidase
MPKSKDPTSGLITNWNNKPAVWWPNGDTPAWGRIFRVSALIEALQQPKINVQDVELAAWKIARTEPSYPFFAPYLSKLPADSFAGAQLRAFDGRTYEGSIGATLYNAWLDALREELFLEITGNLLTPDNFRMAVQPSLILSALERKTKVDYLGKRPPLMVANAALTKAAERVRANRGDDYANWGFKPNAIGMPNQAPIPYSDRGTYIQIVQLLTNADPIGRSVLPPGVSESGPHSLDQAPLARAWLYKPMRFWTEPKD